MKQIHQNYTTRTQSNRPIVPARSWVLTNRISSRRQQLATGLNDSAVSAYYSLMVESATILGANRQEAEQQLLEVLNFETTLANVSVTVSMPPWANYKNMSH